MNNQRRLVIIGASGHGKVVADIAMRSGYRDVVFLDDKERVKECAGFSVIGKTSIASKLVDDSDFIVAIGDANVRERFQQELNSLIVSLVHPNATVSRRVKIGKGCVVMAGAVINSDSIIGDGCIVNTGSTIDHDCVVGNFAHISVGAHLAGSVRIGNRTWVGIGATVSNNISICDDCIIGAGAVVIRDIEEAGTYVGIPAKAVSKKLGGVAPNLWLMLPQPAKEAA